MINSDRLMWGNIRNDEDNSDNKRKNVQRRIIDEKRKYSN